MIHEIVGIIVQALKITVFVLVMMMILEYITVQTKNKWTKYLKSSPVGQILSAALLGLIPGCMGTFAVVSMYVHRSISFAALVTALIATSGDDAFFMFAKIPGDALLIMGSIGGIAIITGFILQAVLKNPFPVNPGGVHFKYHEKQDECACFEPDIIPSFYSHLIWQRLILILSGFAFVGILILNVGGHGHSHDLVDVHGGHGEWGWERITFLVSVIIGLLITLTVPNHFVKEHIWGHVIKKHFLKVFLWTLAAFIALHFLNDQMDIKNLIADNMYYIMLIALLVGMIPESGPHIVFITLFFDGHIPISILIANSIVQDGHGSIPLLAESGKSFILAKTVNLLVGAIVGYGLLLMGI